MKSTGVNLLYSYVLSLLCTAPRFPRPIVSGKNARPLFYLPYFSLMILLTAAMGARFSQRINFYFDPRPFAGISRNSAMGRANAVCQALTNASTQAVAAESVSLIEPATNTAHNEWEIICRTVNAEENAIYILKWDARRDRLICFQKENTRRFGEPIGLEDRGGENPRHVDRAAALEIARRYLSGTGLAAETLSMTVSEMKQTSDGRLWDIFVSYAGIRGDRRKARIGLLCKNGELDRFLTWQ